MAAAAKFALWGNHWNFSQSGHSTEFFACFNVGLLAVLTEDLAANTFADIAMVSILKSRARVVILSVAEMFELDSASSEPRLA